MEQELKEKIIFWLYNCGSYEEFETKNYYETDRRLIETTIDELVHKLLKNNKIIWNISHIDIVILKTFLNVNNPGKTITTSETASKLKTTQSVVYNSLCKTKNYIIQEINKRRIMNMSKCEVLDLSVGNFNLSNRAVTTLLNNNIFSIGELLELTPRKLKTLEYMGPKTAQEILDKVHSFRLLFEGEQIITTEETLREELDIKLQKRYNIEQEIAFLLKYKEDIDKEIDDLSEKLEHMNKRKKLKIK